jgi:hypothetical protein
MKIKKPVKIIILLCAWCIPNIMALTAEDIASHLGIYSWETQVDLPINTYTIELYEIKNGALGTRLTMDEMLPKSHQNHIIVMAQIDEKNKANATLKVGDFVHKALPINNLFRNSNEVSFKNEIPSTITSGEYPLVGNVDLVKTNKTVGEGLGKNVSDYSNGIVLKVTSKNL